MLQNYLDEIERVLREPEDDASKAEVGEWDDDDELVRSARAIREELGHVQTALRRLKDGTYGRCEVCEEPICLRRLRARPQATECFRCAGVRHAERRDEARPMIE